MQITQMENHDVHMSESFVEKRYEQDAQRFETRFADYLTDAASAFNEAYSKFGKQWSLHDTVALGTYLEQWENFCQMTEEDVTTRDVLGDYMKVGLGLAAIQYVALPASFLASVQPLADEVGLIYFRELVSTMARGNIGAGEVIGSQGGRLSNDLDTYYQEAGESTTALFAMGAPQTTPFAIALCTPVNPVRPRTIEVTITSIVGGITTTYNGIDDGNSFVIGNWPTPAGLKTGTINYTTGAVVINLTDVAYQAGSQIVIKFHQALDQASEIPGFLYRLSSKSVRANYFILENQYSTLADYAVRRRFGRALSDDVASAAVAQINSAVLSAIIRKLNVAATNTGTTEWSATPPAGGWLVEHRKTVTDSFEAAAQLIDAQTGRGAVTFVLAGAYMRRVLNSIGVDMVRKPLPGPYLTGFFQNVPVFYVPEALVSAAYSVVGYRGANWFECPVVYAPFLPIVMVKGVGSNVFNRITGVAHSAAIETVVEGFCARIKITNWI